MDLPEFLDLVRRMRERQAEFFRTRNQNLIGECRDLERRIDAALKGMADASPGRRQPTLFDAPEDPTP